MAKATTIKKLQAHLAMAAFIIIAVAAILLTSIGLVTYATKAGVAAAGSQHDTQQAPFGASALSPNSVNGSEN